MEHRYYEVDVFSTGPYTGNPLGVVCDADSLTSAQMAAIANWTNFSETIFLLAPTIPGADYQVRIFTPHEEFDFAGHPTLGAARVVAELTGARGSLVQQCRAGLITVRQDAGIFSFATPPLRKSGPLDPAELQACLDFLGIDEAVDSAWVDNGPGWRLIQLADAATVRAVRPTGPAPLKVGIVGLERPTDKDYAPAAPIAEVRAFTPSFEDPVTGSFNGGAAQFLRAKDAVLADYVVAQGSQLGRAGRVHIHDDGQDIWVGGAAEILVEGVLRS